jgi:hypothetical protein
MKEEPMGAWEALKEGVKEGVQGLYPGLTLGNILKDLGETVQQKAIQGSAELAAALNYGNSAYVPYGQGQWMRGEREGAEQHQEHEQKQEQEIKRGISM